jgi:flagellar motor switch protein FliN/FliY
VLVSEGLSQEEIDALLAGGLPSDGDAAEPEEPGADTNALPDAMETPPIEGAVAADVPATDAPVEVDETPIPIAAESGAPALDGDEDEVLAAYERDALGEIGNITMASAATALNALLNQPVQITTPRVAITTEAEIQASLSRPSASVTVGYTEGLNGRNVFVLARRDCSVIVDLMMGGDGSNPSDELDELQISGVGEAMNQMMGSAATALASMVGRKVDLTTPEIRLLDAEQGAELGLDHDGPVVRVSFDLTIGSLLQTEIMQILPVDFARQLVASLVGPLSAEPDAADAAPVPPPGVDEAPVEALTAATAAPALEAAPAAPPPAPAPDGNDRRLHPVPPPPPPTVRPAAFPSLDEFPQGPVQGDIGLLLDVPLQVTVELGRTQLRIRNVLELVPGSIIELEKLSGEPVDVLVNGRQIARGEVVVIDEEFGVRITDIASRAARLRDVAG